MIKRALVAVALAVYLVYSAAAQDHNFPTPGNATVPGTVPMCLNPSGQAIPCANVSPTSTSALATSQVIKGSAGNLYSFEVSADSTLSASAWWIMIFNATSAPADGSVTPAKCYAIPAGVTSMAAAFNVPVNFSTGITIVASSTGCFTKTASAHAFISGDAQ